MPAIVPLRGQEVRLQVVRDVGAQRQASAEEVEHLAQSRGSRSARGARSAWCRGSEDAESRGAAMAWDKDG